jgi:predicted enzyme related to lactoylglutathione lyase
MAMHMGFFSIPTRDMNSAKNFYQNIMGWEFQERDEDFTYIYADNEMIGSLEKSDDSFSPSAFGPKMYFRANSISEVMTKVKANKGLVLKDETAIEDGARGYTSEILDTSGNRIAFWAEKP